MPARPLPARRAVPALLLATLIGVARGDEPVPLQGWSGEQAPAPDALRVSPPLDLEVEPPGTLGPRARELAAAGSFDQLARLLAARARDPELRGRLLRGGRAGAALLGAQEDARRRLLALPAPSLAVYQGEVQRVIEELRSAQGALDAAALRERRGRFPGWAGAPEAAARLGDLALEEGRTEDAAAWWRLAVSEAPALALQSRQLALRARPRWDPTRAGAVGGERRAAVVPGLAWARRVPAGAPGAPPRRAATCDGERVFVSATDGVLALETRWGRVVWSEGVAGLPRARPPAELLLWEGRLIALHRAELRLLDPRSGEGGWRVSVEALLGAAPGQAEEGLVRAAPAEGLVVVLGRVQGEWVLAAVGPDGALAWRTRLWRQRSARGVTPVEPRFVADGDRPCRADDCPGPELHPERSRWRPWAQADDWRPVLDDGQLECVGPWGVVTAEGVVAAVDLLSGGLVWVRARYGGRALGRGAVRVALRAEAHGVLALTATGALVRLDPLDGRELPTVAVGEEPGSSYLLCARPLLVGWEGGRRLVSGEGLELGPLDATPVWAGGGWGPLAAVPTAEGVVWVDASGAGRIGRSDWPLGPARVRIAAGVAIAVNTEGVAALAPGHAPPPPLPEVARSAAEWITLLDHRDWRRRERAREALREQLRGPAPADTATRLREVCQRPSSVDLLISATQLLDGLEALNRWRRILPDAAHALHEQLAWGEGPRDAAPLVPLLGPGEAPAAALTQELRRRADPSIRQALTLLLLHADRAARGWLVAQVRNAIDPRLARAGADLLVAYARTGGSDRALRLLLRQWDATSPVVHAVVLAGDEALWESLRPRQLGSVSLAEVRQGLAFGRVPVPPADVGGLQQALLEHLSSR